MTVELSCRELVEIVTEYLEGTLPPAERARFDAHLAGCEGCQTYLEQMKQMMQLMGCLTEEMIAPRERAELLRLFQQWKGGAGG